jgi:Reverse transcriptase (RNA-dependent DNA polymerase)
VNAKLGEDVFMKMPPGHRRTGTILKLNKALCGLRKSPLLWQKELTRTIRQLGFEPVPHEPCCFMKNGIIMFFYVDDIVFSDKRHQKDIVLGPRQEYY